MKFMKQYFNVRFIKTIILSFLFFSFNGLIDSGVVSASGAEPDASMTRNTENSSDVDQAKEWKFRDLEGKDIEFGQLKGKVIFLNIWATWCRPCIFEMQSIQKLYDVFKNEDIVFLIASSENKKTVKRFYKKNKYTFPVYTIHKRLPDLFQSRGIPSTFIIDRNGKITFQHLGAVDWNQKSVHEYISSLLRSGMDS